MKHRSRQSGFTLVELSIVLVIIGLIIGGVLTGQQIMQNARATNAINGIQAYQAQFQTYTQNYGVLPGDDKDADERFSNLTGTTVVGDGNGKIDSASERTLAWTHLQAAGLVKNNTADEPANPFSGTFSFHNGAFNSAFTTTTLCLDQVPAYAAQVIDSKLDDGVGDSGSIRAIAYSSTADIEKTDAKITTYSDEQTYILCTRM